jgi:hypothetical protein
MNLSSRSGSTDGMDLDRVGHFLSMPTTAQGHQKELLSRQSPQSDHAFYAT